MTLTVFRTNCRFYLHVFTAWLLGPAVLLIFANVVLLLSAVYVTVCLFTKRYNKTLRRLAIVFCCGAGNISSLSRFHSLLKGGYLDFSHLTELIYITEIYMKKQYKSSIIKNLKITKKKKSSIS